MMFSEMKAKGLYPPRYAVRLESAIPSVTVTLLNEQRPAVWEQVSAFIDKNGAIANRDLRTIANWETLQATRMLKSWVEKGLLVMHGSGKRDANYRKPSSDPEHGDLLLFDSGKFATNSNDDMLEPPTDQMVNVKSGADKQLAPTLKKAPPKRSVATKRGRNPAQE
jgi:hypothetical protein